MTDNLILYWVGGNFDILDYFDIRSFRSVCTVPRPWLSPSYGVPVDSSGTESRRFIGT